MRLLAICVFTSVLTACSNSDTNGIPLSKAGATPGSAGAVPTVPDYSFPSTPAGEDYICASLAGSEGLYCPSPDVGLKGKIYLLENGYSGPEIRISDIITNGITLPLKIQMTNFDVPTRSFTEGFPLSDGSLLKGPSGDPVTAWFAFDLQGYLTLRAPFAPGLYQFAFFVDDGAILTVDGTQVLNFDGYHSPQWSCSTTPLALDLDVKHAMGLQYFQGPPTQLALRMLIRPFDANRPCDDSGGFVSLPANFISN